MGSHQLAAVQSPAVCRGSMDSVCQTSGNLLQYRLGTQVKIQELETPYIWNFLVWPVTGGFILYDLLIP